MPTLAVFTASLGIAVVLAPFWAGEPERVGGLCLIAAAVVELVQGFRRSTAQSQRQAWTGAAYTLVLALLLLNAPWFAVSALVLFVSLPFLIDAARHLITAAKQLTGDGSIREPAVAALWNIAAAVVVLLVGRHAPSWVAGLAAGFRLAQTTVNLAAAPIYSTREIDESIVTDIGLANPERVAETSARIEREERQRAPVDRGWIVSLLLVLFTVHVSRMGFDRSALGVFSPLVAVAGDIVFALALTYALITPVRLFARRVSRHLERSAWERVLAVPSPSGPGRWVNAIIQRWLESRLRFAIRVRATRYSLSAAFGRGLQIGLPLAAIIVASVPIWGMSWYFDTENWAAGVWNSWAAQRTDTWREAMISAAVASGETTLDGHGFAVTPDGVNTGAPFSFVVIGDTGEGDASQHVLRDSLLRAAGAEDVRFVVVSSDVVYPTGAMRDYELRFWLPFKGITRPVYAIPGNHDWYDALEGFVATFFSPAAARTAMRARIQADDRLSSTTDATIERLIQRASFLRDQYGVPTGFQQAPFFQIQTDTFALLAVDTGVLRRVDDDQLTWLRAALEASRGKMTMAVLGHPLFAGGHDTVGDDEGFARVRDVLREYGVQVVMAGDTHDLEYYPEIVSGRERARTIHHWVNGGGGAYLSFGTTLAWPSQPATTEWAHYPNTRDVVNKIETETPWWKWPTWFWTRHFGAWPSSPEWLSAMFDYNSAPFFQSFVVVTVDPAARTLTVKPWGIRGRLNWRDFERSSGVMPAGSTLDQAAEWVIQDPATFR